jgi:glycerol uptake facilitator-like aquaporin
LILVDEGASESYGAPALSSALEGKILGGMAVEALGTFFLVWAIIGVAVTPRRPRTGLPSPSVGRWAWP